MEEGGGVAEGAVSRKKRKKVKQSTVCHAKRRPRKGGCFMGRRHMRVHSSFDEICILP